MYELIHIEFIIKVYNFLKSTIRKKMKKLIFLISITLLINGCMVKHLVKGKKGQGHNSNHSSKNR